MAEADDLSFICTMCNGRYATAEARAAHYRSDHPDRRTPAPPPTKTVKKKRWWSGLAETAPQKNPTWAEAERAKTANVASRPTGDAALVCPHCHSRGTVKTSKKSTKDGLSGAKATAGVITGGKSVALTGLSKKRKVRQARCGRCKMSWLIG